MKIRSVVLAILLLLGNAPLGTLAAGRGSCISGVRAALEQMGETARSPRPDGLRYAKTIQAPSGELKGAVIVTLSDIQRALKTPERIWPPLAPSAKAFFDPLYSPFNSYGAAGSMGPLTEWGANGRNPWNPSTLISKLYWRPWARYLESIGGPLSPLGQWGATGDVPYHLIMPWMGPYGKHMQELGILSFFGPKSAMGPDGLTGTLSGVGSHGYRADPLTGAFKDGKRVVHQVRYDDGESVRSYHLEETYSAKEADRLSRRRDLDASFVVDEKMDGENSHEFNINIRQGTVPEFRVIAARPTDRFAVELYSENGVKIAESNSRDFPTNIIQMKAPHNATVRVRIRYLGSSSDISRSPSDSPGYRFIATEPFASNQDLGFDGPHMTILK